MFEQLTSAKPEPRPPTAPPDASFLDLSRAGRSSPWRYLLGTGLLPVFGFGLSLLPLLLVLHLAFTLGFTTATGLDALETSGDKLVDFAAVLSMFPVMLVGLFIVVRLVHGRPFLSVVTAYPGIRWRRVGLGAAAWVAILIVFLGIDLLQNPGLYRFAFEPGKWLVFAALGLLLVPIQTTAEELQCRGYLLQAAARLSRRPWLVVLPSTILFTLLHVPNPEFLSALHIAWVSYFVFGLLLAAATIRDNGTELALGVHAAHNLFGFLLVGQDGAINDVGAIVARTELDMSRAAIETILAAVAFWLVIFILPGWIRRVGSPDGRWSLQFKPAVPKRPVAVVPDA